MKTIKFYLALASIIMMGNLKTNADAWVQKANVGGLGRSGAVGFNIGTKGYIGTGQMNSGYVNDFWEYNPATNVWTQKANFGGAARVYAVGFSIGTMGYVGTGISGNNVDNSDLWEYNQGANNWTQKASF